MQVARRDTPRRSADQQQGHKTASFSISYNLFPRRRNAATEKLKLLCIHAVRRVLGINCIVVSDPLHEDMQRIGKNIVFPKSLSAIGDENIVDCKSRRQARFNSPEEIEFVFEAALPLQKLTKPSYARPRAIVKRNSLHSASAFRAKAAYAFLPFSSQNQSIGFDFAKEEGGSRAQFSSCLTETERRELLLTRARATNCETSFVIA